MCAASKTTKKAGMAKSVAVPHRAFDDEDVLAALVGLDEAKASVIVPGFEGAGEAHGGNSLGLG